MIKLHPNGAYLIDGKIVLDHNTPTEFAKKGTITYSILQNHNHSKDENKLQIRFDAMVSHDITYVGIIQTARGSGMTEFPIPYALKIAIILFVLWVVPSMKTIMFSVFLLQKNTVAYMFLPIKA
jgi:hypothetical protein